MGVWPCKRVARKPRPQLKSWEARAQIAAAARETTPHCTSKFTGVATLCRRRTNRGGDSENRI